MSGRAGTFPPTQLDFLAMIRTLGMTTLLAVSTVLAGCGLSASAASGTPAPTLKVIASGLNQPKKLTIAPNGSLIVALSGDGKAPSSCTNGDQRSCLDRSGAIDEVGTGGRITTLLSGLPSISSGPKDPQATGPVEATVVGGELEVLFQNTVINAKSGKEIYGTAGALLDDLVAFSKSGKASDVTARFGPFEASHNPDHGVGTDVSYGDDFAIDSDPYSFVPYRGGYAVADAGANDLLFVSRTGKVSVLAVLPTIREKAAAGTYGSAQKHAIEAQAQAAPTAVAVGPDGALYVGELGGIPFGVGTSDVYRVVPGHKPTVYARGFTAIGDIAFDPEGRLLVLELDRRGLGDPGLNDGRPASGAIIRIANDGKKSLVVSSGLDFPTALVVARDGYAYVSGAGTTSADSGHGGEIIRVKLS
jgi:hypothetical protein